MVQKGEEQEFSLYNQVKSAEYARQQQEQKVKKMAARLHEMRRSNAVKIKEEMTQLEREDRELDYKLQREQAELAKVWFCWGWMVERKRDFVLKEPCLIFMDAAVVLSMVLVNIID